MGGTGNQEIESEGRSELEGHPVANAYQESTAVNGQERPEARKHHKSDQFNPRNLTSTRRAGVLLLVVFICSSQHLP
jgi:hypothetical protein